MPVVTSLFLSLVAGLLLGFSGHDTVGAILAGALALTGKPRRADAVLSAAVLGFGLLQARAALDDDARCRRQVLETRAASVHLVNALERGRSAFGFVVDGCRLPVRIRANQPAPAGATIAVEGLVSRGGDAVVVRDARVVVVRTPGALATARARLAALIDTLYVGDAALAKALTIADQRDVAPDLRDRFADAGIIHMLSVSGLHVSIIAGALLAMFSGVGLAQRRAVVASLVATAAYVILIGAPPPAVRSVGMCALTAFSRILQRPTSPWAVWAGGSALSLVEPRIALDLGWQLSVGGMAGLIASGLLLKRLALPLAGWKAALTDNMIATTVASVASAPLCAWEFGRISVAAVATNLAAAPLFNVVQPLLFASIITSPLRPVGAFLADAARSGLRLVDLVARIGASVPGAVLEVSPDGPEALAATMTAAALILACQLRHPRRAVTVALGAMLLGVAWPWVARGPGRMEVFAIDVGQGDALALRSPRGRWLLIDAGTAWKTGDAAEFSILPLIRRWGGDVVHLVLTHPHLDHIGGARPLLTAAAIDTLWDAGYVEPSGEYAAVLATAIEHRVAWRAARAGDRIAFDGVTIRVLAPDSAWVATRTNPNDASVVVQVSYGEARLLFTGDAERDQEAWLVEHYGDSLRSTVLKLGHHGSSTSSTPPFLEAVSPRISLVSVGAGNRYGHPAAVVLQALDAAGSHVLRTDDVGTIMLRTDGKTMDLFADGRRWRYSAKPLSSSSADETLRPPR